MPTCGRLGVGPGAHHGGIDGDEEIAASARGQSRLRKRMRTGPIFLGHDGRAKIYAILPPLGLHGISYAVVGGRSACIC